MSGCSLYGTLLPIGVRMEMHLHFARVVNDNIRIQNTCAQKFFGSFNLKDDPWKGLFVIVASVWNRIAIPNPDPTIKVLPDPDGCEP
jgi:hypothetical protein